jgi:hypothetical protein
VIFVLTDINGVVDPEESTDLETFLTQVHQTIEELDKMRQSIS